MRTTAFSLLIVLIACSAASAQTDYDLQVQLGAYVVTPHGGEQPGGVWRSTGPVVIGKPVSSTYSFGTTCEAWMVSYGRVPQGRRNDRVENRNHTDTCRSACRHVPITLGADCRAAAAARSKFLGCPQSRRLPGEDIELRLGPGESWPVDSVRVPPGAKMVDGRPCGGTASIRVSVDRYPGAEAEHRLIRADLWLVERLPDGTEAQLSQPLAVRGLPGRPFNFYFDSIVDGDATLDIYGILIARRLGEEIAVSVETRSRWAPELRNIRGPQNFVNSEIRVKPSETVEIRLPLLGDDAGPFAKRALSIRIRARQLR